MTFDELAMRVAADLHDTAGAGQVRREAVARHLAEFFGVAPDDVGVFTYDPVRQRLVLCWPSGLRIAGDIPLDSHNALVAATARERRPRLENEFSGRKHAEFFERVLPGGRVQKILSVPVIAGDSLLGVLQVCRKGGDPQVAGPDFTPADTAAMENVAALLAAAGMS